MALLGKWLENETERASLTADILACGPRAIRLQKRLMQDWEALPPAGAIQAGVECFVESWRSPEPTEMMAAFLASKRKK